MTGVQTCALPISNILIKFNEDGTKAASETYMHAACKYRNKAKKPTFTVLAHCRDIDKWEKRDGKWVIVKRIVAGDNSFMLNPSYTDDYNNGRGKTKENDPSYTIFGEIE